MPSQHTPGRAVALLAVLSLFLLLSARAADETAWTKASWATPAFRLPFPADRLGVGVAGGGGEGKGDDDAQAVVPSSLSPPAPPGGSGGRVSSSLGGPAGLWGAPAAAVLPPDTTPPPWAALHTAAVTAAPALACDVCLALAERAWEAGVAWVGTEGGVPPAAHRVARFMRAACDGGTGPPGGATPLGVAPKAALAVAGLKEEAGGRWVRAVRPAPAAPTTPPQPPTPLEAAAARQACLTLTDSPPPPLPGPGPGGGGAAYAHHGPPAAAVLTATTPLPAPAAAVADALAALARRTVSTHAAAGRPLPRPTRPPATPRTPPPPRPGKAPACADYHPECPAWAARGECERNVRYMCGDLALDGDRPPPPPPGSGDGGGGGGGRARDGPTHWRGHCRLSCGLCAPPPDALPRPLEGEPGVALGVATASLRTAALLRACVAAPPCGGSTADAAVAKAALAAVAGGAGMAGAALPQRAQAAAAAPPTPPSPPAPSLSVGPFQGKCFLVPAGYWTFEACPGVSARQAHYGGGGASDGQASVAGGQPGPGPSHSLGAPAGSVNGGLPQTLPASDLPPDLADRGVAVRYVSEAFVGGDACEGGGAGGPGAPAAVVARSAELRLACPPDALVRATVAEPETCRYVLTLFHPDACELTDGKEEGGGGVVAAGEEEEQQEEQPPPAAAAAGAVDEEGIEGLLAAGEVVGGGGNDPATLTPPAEEEGEGRAHDPPAAVVAAAGAGAGPPADDLDLPPAAGAATDDDEPPPPDDPLPPPPPLPLVHEEL